MDKTRILFIIVLALFACKTKESCLGKSHPETTCPANYDPVCGCDGKTYSNACSAEASGIKKWVVGECK